MAPWVEEGTRRGRTFHFDKTLNLGHLLTIIVLAGSLWAFSIKIENRLTTLEVRVSQIDSLNEKVDQLMRYVYYK